MINSVCGTGSTGRICTDIADMLIAQGHECKIAYGRGSVSEKYKNISHKIGSDFDVKMHALAARLFDCSGFCSKAVIYTYVKCFKWQEKCSKCPQNSLAI